MSDETQQLENQDTQIATQQIETNETTKQNGHTDENSKTPATMSHLCLKLISNVTKNTIFPLNIGMTTLGRSKSSDICLIHKSVSRSHASIQIDLSKDTHEVYQCGIIDQGSLNKTRLNNTELTKEDKNTLNINDQIELGALKFKLEKMTDEQETEQQLNRTSSIDLYDRSSPTKTKPGLLEIQNTMEETMLIEDEKSQAFDDDTDLEDNNLDNTSCPDFRLHMSTSFINQSVVSNKSLAIPETMSMEEDQNNDDPVDDQKAYDPIESNGFSQTLVLTDDIRDDTKTVLIDTQLEIGSVNESEKITDKTKESHEIKELKLVEPKEEDEKMNEEIKESKEEEETKKVDLKTDDDKMIEEMKESHEEKTSGNIDQEEDGEKMNEEMKESQEEEETKKVDLKKEDEKIIEEIKESNEEEETKKVDLKTDDDKMKESHEEKTSENVDQEENGEKMNEDMKENQEEEEIKKVDLSKEGERMIDEIKESHEEKELKKVEQKEEDEKEKTSGNIDQEEDGEKMTEELKECPEEKKREEPKRRGRPRLNRENDKLTEESKKSDNEPKKKAGRPRLSSAPKLSREDEKMSPKAKIEQKESSDFEVKKYNCLNDESIIINDDDDDEIDLEKLKNQKNIILAEPEKLPDEIMVESTLMDTSANEPRSQPVSQLSDTEPSQTLAVEEAPVRRGKGRPRSINTTAKNEKSATESKGEEKQRRRSTRISLPEREDTENIAEEASEQKPEAKVGRRSSLRVRNTPNPVVRPKRGPKPLEEENGEEQKDDGAKSVAQRKSEEKNRRKTMDTSQVVEQEPKRRGRPRLVKEDEKLSPKRKLNENEHSKVKKNRRAKKNQESSDDEDNETLGNVKKMLRKQSAEAESSPKIFFNSKRRKTPNSSLNQTPKINDNADTPSKKFKLHKAISSSDENLNDDVEEKDGQEPSKRHLEKEDEKKNEEEEVEEEEELSSLPVATTRNSNRSIRNQN